YRQRELHLYGSSRIGIDAVDRIWGGRNYYQLWNPYLDKYIRQRDTLRNVDVRKNHYIYRRGQKHYEMTNQP
ncbi:MAG: hypothetical protein ACK5XP_10835, partial [Sphingobacteriia bacterium]